MDESTARYLRGLRSAAESTPPSPASPREHRRHPRYKCVGSVELWEERSNVRTWGTVTDISRSGCYVEMQATYPPDSCMNLKLELEDIRFQAKAIVRVTYPFVGMGMAFTQISPEDRVRLEQVLQRLAARRDPASALTPKEKTGKNAAEDEPDPGSVLKALKEHFENNDRLTREDFQDVLRQAKPAPGV